jgi:two-component system LytT family response regulator
MNAPMYRAIIVDDERVARLGLRAMLARHAEVEVVGEASSGVEAAAAIGSKRPDLVFLDIQMPDRDGFELLAKLPSEERPAVIFVTAHARYALAAFGIHAVDYLLKPFNQTRLDAAVWRAVQFLRGAAVTIGESWPEKRLVARDGARLVFIDPTQVRWLEAFGNYVRLTVGGRAFLLRETVGAIVARLDPRAFVRINRSVVVNLRHVESVRHQDNGQSEFRLAGGVVLRSSRRYRRDVRAALDG